MYRISVRINIFISIIILSSLGGCVHQNVALDIGELRRNSYLAIISDDEVKKRQAAQLETSVGIRRIIRKSISPGEALLSSDIKKAIILENLVSENEAGQYLNRGAKSGPSESIHAVSPEKEIIFNISFRGNQSGLIMISSISKDLKLSVIDNKNDLKCEDKIVNGVALCRLLPNMDSNFTIKIINLNKKRAVFTLLTN